ncbi:MAG: M48 family metallopeptidase [Coriobacteriaceae bacterium]|jgi:predicted metal-dependent hydrolase|nr:M48 family metallopeptidase [Coriobacteriaceae bacterium]
MPHEDGRGTPVEGSRAEAIEFDNMKVAIRRQATHETYIALQPPDAAAYIVAPLDKKPEEIVAFVKEWIGVIREVRADMLKRFEKSKSPKCHYQTGDVAFLFGRPFMLRVFPISSTGGKKKASRVRANVNAAIRSEVSVIDLFLFKTGDYDQARLAFLAMAKPIFARNAEGLVRQCMGRAFPEAPVPAHVKVRPLRGDWVQIDRARDTVWVSEGLIPYPPECMVYAYLHEMAKILAPEAGEEERHALLDRGLPGWPKLKAILADADSPYAHQ